MAADPDEVVQKTHESTKKKKITREINILKASL